MKRSPQLSVNEGSLAFDVVCALVSATQHASRPVNWNVLVEAVPVAVDTP